MADRSGITDAPVEDAPAGSRPRVVVVGAGFAGMEAACRLVREDVDTVLVDRQNYHLFQPLIYQVATATLQPADIAVPVRRVLARRGRPTVFMDEVVGIDLARRTVVTNERRIGYDWLVLAPGAATSYFGNDGWREHSFALKTLDDAATLRNQILMAFEKAEMAEDEDERARLMTFVIVGGGPNGVGVAAAIAELARTVLYRDFRFADPGHARVLLLEAGERILAGFPEDVSRYAERTLEDKGVEVRTNAQVDHIAHETVRFAGEELAAGTIAWTAGVECPDIAGWLGVKAEKGGRIPVAADLTLPGHGTVFVIGDAAMALDDEGHPLPQLAAVARQQGMHVAATIRARLRGYTGDRPFRYRDYGTTVPLGRGKAVAGILGRDMTGLVAWLAWAAVHIALLPDFRRRLAVAFNWFWAYVTSRRGARIIVTGHGTGFEGVRHATRSRARRHAGESRG